MDRIPMQTKSADATSLRFLADWQAIDRAIAILVPEPGCDFKAAVFPLDAYEELSVRRTWEELRDRPEAGDSYTQFPNKNEIRTVSTGAQGGYSNHVAYVGTSGFAAFGERHEKGAKLHPNWWYAPLRAVMLWAGALFVDRGYEGRVGIRIELSGADGSTLHQSNAMATGTTVCIEPEIVCERSCRSTDLANPDGIALEITARVAAAFNTHHADASVLLK